MKYLTACDGVDVCMDGSFDCEACVINKGAKPEKSIIKKPKAPTAPPKKFKRRKK